MPKPRSTMKKPYHHGRTPEWERQWKRSDLSSGREMSRSCLYQDRPDGEDDPREAPLQSRLV